MSIVIDLDNIVTLARVYFLADITAAQQAKVKACLLKQIKAYDKKCDLKFDLKACTAELLKQL